MKDGESVLAHGPECPCPRCRGFERGNDLPVTHGAYRSLLKLSGRIDEIAARLADAMPHAGFAHAIQATALAAARLEAVAVARDTADDGAQERLDREEGRWWTRYLAGLKELGLTPLAASKLGLQIAVAQAAHETALERHMKTNYSADEAEKDESL